MENAVRGWRLQTVQNVELGVLLTSTPPSPANPAARSARNSAAPASPRTFAPNGPSRGRWSHSDTALYMLYGAPLMQYTGWCENDFNVQGLNGPQSSGSRSACDGPPSNSSGAGSISVGGAASGATALWAPLSRATTGVVARCARPTRAAKGPTTVSSVSGAAKGQSLFPLLVVRPKANHCSLC
jgi:hypothetical protein